MTAASRIVFGCVSLLAVSLAAADPAPQLIDVHAYGRPVNYDNPRGPKFFVWADEEGWHLRCRTGGRNVSFRGAIRVEGGKFSQVKNFASLEQADHARATDQLIEFQFSTNVHGDGFDFQVGKGVKQLIFDLSVDGERRPEWVMIGANAQPAPRAVFALSATQEPKDNLPKKKKAAKK